MTDNETETKHAKKVEIRTDAGTSLISDAPYFEEKDYSEITELGDETEQVIEFKDSSSSESDHWIDPKLFSTPPAEYWHVQKLIKFIKAGNQTATAIALACLTDHDLSSEFNRVAIRDIGGLETLINILETNDFNCVSRALDVLNEVSKHTTICRDLSNLGIIPVVVNLLINSSKEIQNKAAYLISTVSKLKRARKLVYAHGGIPLLIGKLEVPQQLLNSPTDELDKDQADVIECCIASAKALYSLSKSSKIKKEMIKQGILRLIKRLLYSIHDEIVLYTMGFFQNCASEEKCQLAIETEDIVEGILLHLLNKSIKLRELCSQAIFKSCEKQGPRKLVYYHKGCDYLITLLKDRETETDINLLIAVAGAIWKCSLYEKNLEQLDSLDATKLLLRYLRNDDEELLINVIGGLTELAKIPKNRETIHKEDAIKTLVSFLKYTNNILLVNVTKCLGECAKNPECMNDIDNLDAVRLIWSLLKNRDPAVQANAAFALVPCISNAPDSGEMVRSFVGGLELLIARLTSPNELVVAGVCAAIAVVATDRENLAVISDHGVMSLLAKHINTKNQILRKNLAAAIAEVCWWSDNCHMFGQLNVCRPIIDYIKTDDEESKVTAAQALRALSFDPINCITLHRNGAVPHLLEATSSQNVDLQLAAAGCLANIRRLVLKADKIQYRTPKIIYKDKKKQSKLKAPSISFRDLNLFKTSLNEEHH